MLKNDYMKEMEHSLDLIKEEVDREILKGEFFEAKLAINKQLKTLVGLEIETIDTLSFESIKDILSRDSYYNVWKYIALGELLQLQGLVCCKEDDELKKIIYYQKSLQAFYQAYDEEEIENKKYNNDILSLLYELRDYELNIEDDKKIMRLYEYMDKFDKSEDMIFYIIEKSQNNKQNILEGLEFYNRLKKKTEEVLMDGNFSMEEVEQGYSELKKMLDLA